MATCNTEAVPGAKTFALWPLSQAAQSCFGKDSWPADMPAPKAWLEFDVESVEEATAVLESAGYRMPLKNKKETEGVDRQPFSLARRVAGRYHFHSIDANLARTEGARRRVK